MRASLGALCQIHLRVTIVDRKGFMQVLLASNIIIDGKRIYVDDYFGKRYIAEILSYESIN